MPHRVLNQTGMNRILWKLLAAVGGKFTITNRELETIDRTVGIGIEHNEATDTFVLQLHKVNQKEPLSDIIITPDTDIKETPNLRLTEVMDA